jgi:hypothetical protein
MVMVRKKAKVVVAVDFDIQDEKASKLEDIQREVLIDFYR